MIRQERTKDFETALLAALQGWQAGLWTALPCIVESFDADKQTCVLQPTIKGIYRSAAGDLSTHNLPLLLDVPVYRLRGGGFSITVPLSAGDEGLAIFASRCIDAWWQNGGVQEQNEIRMHDLSDGFFLPGFNSQTKNLSAFCTDGIQLRNDAGDTTLTLRDGSVDIVAAATNITGDLNVTGKLNVSDLTIIGDPGAAKFVKLSDNTNSTKLKAS